MEMIVVKEEVYTHRFLEKGLWHDMPGQKRGTHGDIRVGQELRERGENIGNSLYCHFHGKGKAG